MPYKMYIERVGRDYKYKHKYKVDKNGKKCERFATQQMKQQFCITLCTANPIHF